MKKTANLPTSINPKVPNHIQFDTVSPATKLLEKRRMMYEVHEAFEQQKEEFKKQELAFERQENLIRDRDLVIQEDLIRFCKFLQDNDAKKLRAEKRYDDEKKARDLKEKEIQELNQQLQDLQRHTAKLERKVAALRKYEEYLELVYKSNTDQYQDLQEILQRHNTLEKSNKTLKANHSKKEQDLQALKNEFLVYEKEKTNEVLLLNTEIATLQKKRDEIESKRNELQTNVEHTSKESSDKNLNLGRIIFAIDHLYQRCQDTVQKMKMEGEDKPGFSKQMQQQQQQQEADRKITHDKGTKNKPGVIESKDKVSEDEENFKKKCQQAIEKLKGIGFHMQDFSNIIEDCRKEGAYKKDK